MDDGSSETGRLARRVDEIRLLDQVSTELNSVLEPERIMGVVIDSMHELFGARCCDVFLRAEPTAGLVLSASRGQPSQKVRERVRMGQGIVGAAAAKREIVRVNFQRDRLPIGSRGEIQSRMAIPMLAKGELVGVVYVETIDKQVLRKGDERLVTIVANQAAVALQNARLYEGLQGLNEELERRVHERTAELEARNHQLQETQAQLVQSGKMAALGELAAGLAHEMNTPLGAINASADVAGRAVALIREAGPPPADSTVDARKLSRALSALEGSTQASREACGRVSAIVTTLRRFARLDQAELQWVDLHGGLDDALSLLAHRIGDHMKVVREYAELPNVRCYAGEVNQVFLIALTNAVDAIAGHGVLTIRTRSQDDSVVVEIADDGAGIAAAALPRVFDPGFTTKGVGVGTGLSLAIAYRILEKHGGDIALESTLDEGTTTVIRLPVAGSD